MIFSQEGNLKGYINHLKTGKFFASNVYLRLYDKSRARELESDLAGVLIPYLSNSFGPPLDAIRYE